jgi:hypothetical protein
MDLLAKHPINLITLKPTSAPFLGKNNHNGEDELVVMRV